MLSWFETVNKKHFSTEQLSKQGGNLDSKTTKKYPFTDLFILT